MIKKTIKDYLTFTRKERNGIVILITIIVILLFVNRNLDYFYANNYKSNNFAEYKKEINRFEKSLQLIETKTIFKSKKKNKIVFFEPFKFDPNYINKYDWKKLNLSEANVKTINNYIKSGARFNSKEDFKKIYGISNAQYEKLEPFIIIKTNIEENSKINNEKINKNKYNIIVEINKADIESLKTISGIGDVFSTRIINYRNILGGYLNKNQLMEVYGINNEKFCQIEKHIIIDTSLVKKININTATFSELIRHPYLDKYHTQSILNYRKLMGNFDNLDLLLENNILDKELFNKMEKYLSTK